MFKNNNFFNAFYRPGFKSQNAILKPQSGPGGVQINTDPDPQVSGKAKKDP
jgi:hypothetical protein